MTAVAIKISRQNSEWL